MNSKHLLFQSMLFMWHISLVHRVGLFPQIIEKFKGHNGHSLEIASGNKLSKEYFFPTFNFGELKFRVVRMIKLVSADQCLGKFDFLQILDYKAGLSF